MSTRLHVMRIRVIAVHPHDPVEVTVPVAALVDLHLLTAMVMLIIG